MTQLLFVLPAVEPGDSVRVDTASGSNTPATVYGARGGAVVGPTFHADPSGALPHVYGADGVTTLYLKHLNYKGTVTGSPVTLAGVDDSVAPPSPSAASTPVLSGRFKLGLFGPGGTLGPFQADPTADLTVTGGGDLLEGFPVYCAMSAGSTLKLFVGKIAETVEALGFYFIVDVFKMADADGIPVSGSSISCERARFTPASVDVNSSPFLTFEAENDSGIDDVNFSAPDASTITFVEAGHYQILIGMWVGAPPSP